METRQIIINQVRVFKLILNDMRAPKVEHCTIVAVSDDYKRLVQWHNQQVAPQAWRDGRWSKTYKKGSDLEWYNIPESTVVNDTNLFGQGIQDEWIREELWETMKKGFDKYIIV